MELQCPTPTVPIRLIFEKNPAIAIRAGHLVAVIENCCLIWTS